MCSEVVREGDLGGVPAAFSIPDFGLGFTVWSLE